MICALLFAATTQVGQDASILYNQIQNRVANSGGFSMEYTTGPDSWDTDVDIIYDRAGRFTKGHKGYSLVCDGKWYLEFDTGDVTHRRAKPNEIYYVPGLESLYPNVPRLEVFGKVEEVKPYMSSDYKVWKINYRKDGKEMSFQVDPGTRLPLHVTLLPFNAQIKQFTVPGYRKQADVVKLVEKSMVRVKSILLRRKIYDRDKQQDELILMFRNGKAYVASQGPGAKYPIEFLPRPNKNEKLRGKWIAKGKPVMAKTLALPGFEAFTGSRVPFVGGESKLDFASSYSNGVLPGSSFAWCTNPKSGSWHEVRYGQLSLWPDSAYVFRSPLEERRMEKMVSYDIAMVDPLIALPKVR